MIATADRLNRDKMRHWATAWAGITCLNSSQYRPIFEGGATQRPLVVRVTAVARAAAWIAPLVALTAACQQKQSPPASMTSYPVRVSALIEGRALTQTGQSFARLCAPSPPDIILTPVEAQNGPANLKNVDEGRADVAFIGASLLYRDIEASSPSSLSDLKTSVDSRCCNRWSSTCWLARGRRLLPSRIWRVARSQWAVQARETRSPLPSSSRARVWRVRRRDPDRLRQRDRQIVRWIGRCGDATGPDAVPIRDRSHEPRRAARRDSRYAADRLRERVRFMHPITIPLTPTRGSTNGW